VTKLHRITAQALLIALPVIYIVLETAGVGHP
jgi:hypothetical protein